MSDAATPQTSESPRNSALSLGLATAVLAALCNVVLFLNPPAQRLIPWLSLILGIVALAFLAVGVKNLITQAPFRKVSMRILGVCVALLSLLLSAGSIFMFMGARHVPRSIDAPQVGQTAPDFTLPDSNNQNVSLTQLFAPAAADSTTAATPHSVLLIFYRGYW